MRIAMIYALLDSSSLIRLEHLKAALEIWRYCRESASYIFGSAIGDPVADEILRALRLRPQGMTRNEIRELFQRHKKSNRISQALDLLQRANLAHSETEPAQGGRPAERWLAT